MKIIYSSVYDKMFAELTRHQKGMVEWAMELFKEDPNDVSLKNHTLRKPFSWLRSISVDDDLRILFKERGGYAEVVFLRVGNHDRVYQ